VLVAVGEVHRVPPVGAGAPVAAGLVPVLAAWAALAVGRRTGRIAGPVPSEEHAVVMAPPRARKTGWVAKVILHWPGPVVATSTKCDLFALTSGIRSVLGPVQVFNPQAIGGVLSTFRWNPIRGCEVVSVAIRRADAFAHAVSQKGVEDATFWVGKASDSLRAYFHAAALAGGDMRLVTSWV
jgi:type IV secretory pathway TraG/TraD family ATPase VirD4